MEQETKYTLPTIHLNGTGQESLRSEYLAAIRGLNTFRDTLSRATVHGRDFYPQGPDAINQAIAERQAVHAHLAAVDDYLAAWLDAVFE